MANDLHTMCSWLNTSSVNARKQAANKTNLEFSSHTDVGYLICLHVDAAESSGFRSEHVQVTQALEVAPIKREHKS